MKEWMVIILLVVGGLTTSGCGILPKDVDLGAIAQQAAVVASDKGMDWLQSTQGQAYLKDLVAKYAPGVNPTLLGGGLSSIGVALLLMIRNMVKKGEKDSSKRGEMWAEISKLKESKPV